MPAVLSTTPKTRTIFGREPAAWIGLLEAAVVLAIAFPLGVDQEVLGPVMAVVTAAAGAYTAWATKDKALGYIVGLVKSLAILVAVFGLTLTDAQVGAVVALVTVGFGFLQRSQTAPVVEYGQELVDEPEAPASLVPDDEPGEHRKDEQP